MAQPQWPGVKMAKKVCEISHFDREKLTAPPVAEAKRLSNRKGTDEAGVAKVEAEVAKVEAGVAEEVTKGVGKGEATVAKEMANRVGKGKAGVAAKEKANRRGKGVTKAVGNV